MTTCELAFVEHMRKVCPALEDEKEYSAQFICETYYEALTDWVAASRWGQLNPSEVPSESRS